MVYYFLLAILTTWFNTYYLLLSQLGLLLSTCYSYNLVYYFLLAIVISWFIAYYLLLSQLGLLLITCYSCNLVYQFLLAIVSQLGVLLITCYSCNWVYYFLLAIVTSWFTTFYLIFLLSILSSLYTTTVYTYLRVYILSFTSSRERKTEVHKAMAILTTLDACPSCAASTLDHGYKDGRFSLSVNFVTILSFIIFLGVQFSTSFFFPKTNNCFFFFLFLFPLLQDKWCFIPEQDCPIIFSFPFFPLKIYEFDFVLGRTPFRTSRTANATSSASSPPTPTTTTASARRRASSSSNRTRRTTARSVPRR